MKLFRDIRRTFPSDMWASYLHAGPHSPHCPASWPLSQRAGRHMLESMEMTEQANGSGVPLPRSVTPVLYRPPCMHGMKAIAPSRFSSDGAVGPDSCPRTITMESRLPTEALVPPELQRASRLQAPGGTRAESPHATQGGASGPPGAAEIAGGPAAVPLARITSSSGSSDINGTEEFAEVYSPKRSRAGFGQSPDPKQSVNAFSGPGGTNKAEDLPQDASPSSTTSTGKKTNPPRRSREKPVLLSATDAAVAHIKDLVNNYNERLRQEEARGAAPQPRACGVRVSLQKQGCSGMAYDVAICTEEPPKSSHPSPNPAEGAGVAEAGQEEAGASTGASRRSKNWREDEVVGLGGVEIRVAADAVMLLVGTQVDFVDEEVQTGFVFNNPNQRQSCGCGKSFMV